MDVVAYARQLRRLFLPGQAFADEPQSTLTKSFEAMAEELARIDGRAGQLLAEWDPQTAFELLDDWERVLGLPDDCVQGPQTLEERRAAVLNKLTLIGGQTKEFYVKIAAKLGVIVTCRDFAEFRAGFSAAGDPVSNGDWVHAVEIAAPEVSVQLFRAGRSTAGDSLATWGNEKLECALNDQAPAHAIMVFTYG
jgi:uncharacterized protein YmfQ (DUF2313 family)